MRIFKEEADKIYLMWYIIRTLIFFAKDTDRKLEHIQKKKNDDYVKVLLENLCQKLEEDRIINEEEIEEEEEDFNEGLIYHVAEQEEDKDRK